MPDRRAWNQSYLPHPISTNGNALVSKVADSPNPAAGVLCTGLHGPYRQYASTIGFVTDVEAVHARVHQHDSRLLENAPRSMCREYEASGIRLETIRMCYQY
jgi:hypothetical protein